MHNNLRYNVIKMQNNGLTPRYSTASLSNITSSLNQLAARAGVGMLSLNCTPTSDFGAYEDGRIIVPDGYRPSGSKNIFAATKVGSDIQIIQWQVLYNGNVRSGTTISAGKNFQVTLFYLL